jgi:iron(III) transport system substrate-binding protein
VKTENPALVKMGPFKAEVINVGAVGANQQKVLQMLDRVGYK